MAGLRRGSDSDCAAEITVWSPLPGAQIEEVRQLDVAYAGDKQWGCDPSHRRVVNHVDERSAGLGVERCRRGAFLIPTGGST